MSEIVNLFKLVPVAAHMIGDDNYKLGNMPVVSPDLIFGIELEIENFPRNAEMHYAFDYKEDNSLRNNGKELVSHPTKAKFMQNILEEVFKKHRIKEANYSERCSTHVHMNAQDMTLDQIKVLSLVYQTVERLLFGYVGNDRQDNIFCVPWYQSGLTASFVDKITKDPAKAIKQWVKYASLNFLPLTSKGTIEFRHLHGTNDVSFLIEWMNLLACMQKYAVAKKFDEVKEQILSMNTVSNYDMFLAEVFERHVPTLTNIENYKELLSVGVVDTKLMLLKDVKPVDDLRFLDDMVEREEPGAPQFRWEGIQARVAGAWNADDALAGALARIRERDEEARRQQREQFPWYDPARGVNQVVDAEGNMVHENVSPGGERMYIDGGWIRLGEGRWMRAPRVRAVVRNPVPRPAGVRPRRPLGGF